MIYYNFPHRGAFEYDKFVLNILQYCNEASLLQKKLEVGAVFDTKQMHAAVDEVYEAYAKNSEARRIMRLLEQINI